MRNLNIKAVCFDYYGTLVDIGEPFEKIKNWFNDFLNKENSNILINEFYMNFSKQRAKYQFNLEFMTGYKILENSYRNACSKYGLKHHTLEFNEFISYLFSTPCAYGDANQTIRLLKEKYKVGLITNADNQILEQSITNQGFNFDFVITSEDARCNKPQPEIFSMAINHINVASRQTLMIGDSLSEDILGARDVGMNTIWINRENVKNRENVIKVNSIKEILNYL